MKEGALADAEVEAYQLVLAHAGRIFKDRSDSANAFDISTLFGIRRTAQVAKRVDPRLVNLFISLARNPPLRKGQLQLPSCTFQ